MYGTDVTKDNITNAFDLQDTTQGDPEPIVDLGETTIIEPGFNGSADPSGIRRIFRASVRFGPNRLSRIIVSIVITNIQNANNDSQITVPGAASFNVQLDNFPYRSNDTSAAIEFDVDVDVDEGTLNTNMSGLVDDSSDQLTLQDNTEGNVDFNDTRKIRWKRHVFCDGNKDVVLKSRFFKSTTETPDGGFLVRKKLIITFHISRSQRCNQLFWDPTNDVSTPPDQYIEPTPTATTMTSGNPNPTTTTMTGGNPTGTSPVPTMSGNNVSKLFAGLLLFVIAILI